MVHAPTQESTGVGMAGFAWLCRGEVEVRSCFGFIYNLQILTAVATNAIAGNAGMIIDGHLEIGCTDMAGVALGLGKHMVNRLRCGSNACSHGVTPRTYFRRVLEYAFDVALLAL
jgi:hypothetical protein